MGLFGQMMTVIRAKISALLSGAENPEETLEYAYQRQLELLQKVRMNMVNVVAAKRRLEAQLAGLENQLGRLDEQARQALQAGREDLARLALERKVFAQQQVAALEAQVQDLAEQQNRLMEAEQRLRQKVEAFRTRKEIIKAQYSAAEAQARINEAITGLSEEMADVGLAIERAEEKTARLKARAEAIDELLAAGALPDYLTGRDTLERELGQAQLQAGVEAELARLKSELQSGQRPALKEGGAP